MADKDKEEVEKMFPFARPGQYRHIVLTAGVSLFSRANIFGCHTRELGIFEFKGANPLPPLDSEPEKAINDWLLKMRSLENETTKDPEKVSAEYSLIHALQKERYLARNPEIFLFHTDSFGGRAAVKMLERVLEKDFSAKVHREEVTDFDITDRLKFNRSLGIFMDKLGNTLALFKDDLDSVCFAPIGGYKAMTSSAYMVGSFYGLPMAYLYEDDQVLQQMPPLPVQIQKEELQAHFPIVHKLYEKDSMYMNDFTIEEQKMIKNRPCFYDYIEELVALNAFGRFIFSPYKHLLCHAGVFLSDTVTKDLNHNPSAKKFIFEQIKIFLDKIYYNLADEELYHEKSFESLKEMDLKYHLYKGSSQGQFVFRCAWHYIEEEKKLQVNYIWLDHHNYEREVKEAKGLIEPMGNFKDFTEEILGSLK